MSDFLHEVRVLLTGPRPAFYLVAHDLWGSGCNFDSDGNSRTPEDQYWTELTVELRDGTGGQRIDIDPVSSDPLVLAIRSADKGLCSKAAMFIVGFGGGSVLP